ncbi:DUF2510 domain-containing protein [Homoserinibacter sp. GY 40078]|uniref:DUF2510 domain-containing protein n=1 Tax=Homoserinibacter sp. GY 40078 TaxID=2603275 RepID=UPI00164F78C1|nr:DUF2510 domain-containing protein [Homoserinibacter sp. GY 40078]
MTTSVPAGFYPDPFDPEVFRQWDGERWTLLARLGPDAATVKYGAKHVGKAEPAPGTSPRSSDTSQRRADTAGTDRAAGTAAGNRVLVGAVLWAIIATVVGCVYIFGTQDVVYSDDAGIPDTGAQIVRGIGWLIIGSGVLGVIIAASRR